jgi:hypothetical protein
MRPQKVSGVLVAREEQVSDLITLVRTYLDAYDERRDRLPPHIASERGLWVGRPLEAEFKAVLDYVLALEGAQKRFSKKTLITYVDVLVTEVLLDAAQLDVQVQRLADILNHDPSTRLYIPIGGVEIDAPAYRIGSLSLVRLDQAAFETLIAEPYIASIRAKPGSGKDIDGREAALRKDLASLIDRVCVEISANLDIDLTTQLADRVAREDLCDFLQFAASSFMRHDTNLKIQLAPQPPVWACMAYATSIGLRPETRRSFGAIGIVEPFHLYAKVMETIAADSISRLANMVGREPATEYEQLLRRAVRWFAKAERENHFDDRKLAYVTCVDLFFSDSKRGATKRLSEGFAFAIATLDGESPDLIPGWAGYMCRVFRSRSETSHEGALGTIDEDGISSLRYHVRRFIGAMCRLTCESKADVAAWVSREKSALGDRLRAALGDATKRH